MPAGSQLHNVTCTQRALAMATPRLHSALQGALRWPQIRPTVMKLHQLFSKLIAVFQKEMMKTELPAWGKVFGQLCQGQHAHLMGRDLVLQPREPPTTVGPHLVQLPWTGDSSSPYLLLSAPSVDTTPSKAHKGKPNPKTPTQNSSQKPALLKHGTE